MKQKAPRPLRNPAPGPQRRSKNAYRNQRGGRVAKGHHALTGLAKHSQRLWRRTDPATGEVAGVPVPRGYHYAVQWSTTKRLPWQVRKERRAADRRARASRKANRR